MSGQKSFSKTIKLKTIMDTDSVITGLKKIKDELSSATTSVKGKTILSSVDSDLLRLEKAMSALQAQFQRGFSSNKEINSFDKSLESIITHTLQIRESLQKATNISLTEQTKDVQKELKNIESEIEKITNSARKKLKESAKDVFGKTDVINTIIQQNKIEKTMFDERKKSLDEEIVKQKELLKLKEAEFRSTAKENNLQNRIQSSKFTRYKTGENGIRVDTPLFSAFQLDTKYKYAPNAADVRTTQVTKNGITRLGRTFNDNAVNIINQVYQKALTDIIKNGGEVNDVLTQFANTLKNTYSIIVDTKAIENKVGNDISGIRRAGQKEEISKARVAELNRDEQNIEKLENQRKALDTLSESAGRYGAQIDKANQKQQQFIQSNTQGKTTFENTNHQLSSLSANLGNTISGWESIRRELFKTADAQTKLDNGFNSIIRRFSYLFSAYSVFNYIRRQISATYQDVQNLDKSFAQIAMVTNYHVKDLWQNYDQYAEMANRLGQSTNDVVQASVLFYQQGLETNEVLTLTEDTMKLATLAGVGFADATDLMTAALRGFKLEMDEGAHITDVYSELAAHAAASVNEIANAMNKTAAIANSAGMSFENTAAFLTQMINNIVPYNSDIILNCEYAGKPLELLLLSA